MKLALSLLFIVLSCAGWLSGGWVSDSRVSTLTVDKSIYATLGTAGQATCVATDKRIGVCSSVVSAGGACTCTAF